MLLHIERHIEDVPQAGHGVECAGVVAKPCEGLFCHGRIHVLESLVDTAVHVGRAWTARGLAVGMEFFHAEMFDAAQQLRTWNSRQCTAHAVVNDAIQHWQDAGHVFQHLHGYGIVLGINHLMEPDNES